MLFDLHKKFRYSIDWTDKEYKTAQITYYKHLSKIDFTKAKSLLKYFGDSFFHDAEIISFMINPARRYLEIKLFSINHLEDLNQVREEHNLPEIKSQQYRKEPIIYSSIFQGIEHFQTNITLNGSLYVTDTELHYDKYNKKYRVLISFSESEEVAFSCRNCKVHIINSELIIKYTDGYKKSMPYCINCRSKLLTDKVLSQYKAV